MAAAAPAPARPEPVDFREFVAKHFAATLKPVYKQGVLGQEGPGQGPMAPGRPASAMSAPGGLPAVRAGSGSSPTVFDSDGLPGNANGPWAGPIGGPIEPRDLPGTGVPGTGPAFPYTPSPEQPWTTDGTMGPPSVEITPGGGPPPTVGRGPTVQVGGDGGTGGVPSGVGSVWAGYGPGGQPMQFNYATGQIEPILRATPVNGVDPGVNGSRGDVGGFGFLYNDSPGRMTNTPAMTALSSGMPGTYLDSGQHVGGASNALQMAHDQGGGGTLPFNRADYSGFLPADNATGRRSAHNVTAPQQAKNPYGVPTFSNGNPTNDAAKWYINQHGPSGVGPYMKWFNAGKPQIPIGAGGRG